MQTGVATEMGFGSTDTSAKHLRVGVNSSLVNNAAIAKLLIAKGIITMEEYEKAIADEMEAEVKRYEERIAGVYGVKIKLL